MAIETWETKAEVARDILARSIKKEWLLPLESVPVKTRLNVVAVAKESGILTKREVTITETDATGLVECISAGEWTAEEVLIAFAKRAIIGHQLVRRLLSAFIFRRGVALIVANIDPILVVELCNRVHDRRGIRRCKKA